MRKFGRQVRIVIGVWLLRPLLLELRAQAGRQNEIHRHNRPIERYWMGRVTANDMLLRIRWRR